MKKHVAFFLSFILAVPMFSQSVFHHPGMMHSQTDFDRVKQRIQEGETAATQSLENLRNAGPVRGDHGGNWAVNVDISRGIAGAENYMNAYRNCARAYQCALLWKITGERVYGDIAVDILNAYATWNKSLSGNTNISLIPAFNGYQFLNAAEIMRDYDGWKSEDFEKFKQYMIDVWFVVAQDFLERRHDTVTRETNWFHYYSNWGVGNELFCISLGILCDLPDIYNYGMYWLTEGPGNESIYVGMHRDEAAAEMCGQGWGLLPWFHKDSRGPLGYFAQMQESGRDQGHALASLGLLGNAMQTCYVQGDNLFNNMYNPLVPGLEGSTMGAAAAEYVAAYNNGIDDLPYTLNWWMGDFGPNSRGQWRPIWQLFINAYENRMGIAMPNSKTMHNAMGLEWGGGNYGNNSGGYDHTGWGDLMFNDEPVTSDMAPTPLYPTITGPTLLARGGVDPTIVEHHTGWVSGVTPGTSITMTVSLPDDEEDTGNWQWEDGATGRQRVIVAEHSGLYRVVYTNSKGVKSTQLFSVAVRGEGIKATLDATITYKGRVYTENTLKIGKKSSATLTTVYHNWNYIESEIWYDEDGKEIARGGSYKVTNTEGKDRHITFVLTNQSGVQIKKEFHLLNDDSDVSYLLPDASCSLKDKWTRSISDVTVSGGYGLTGMSGLGVFVYKDPTTNDKAFWGLTGFNVSQKATEVPVGKYRLNAYCIAAQQSAKEEGQYSDIDGAYMTCNGLLIPIATGSAPKAYSLDLYVGEEQTIEVGFANLSEQSAAYTRNGANIIGMDELELFVLENDDAVDYIADLRSRSSKIDETSVPSGIYGKLQQVFSNEESSVQQLSVALNQAEVAQHVYATFLKDVNMVSATAGISVELQALVQQVKAAETVENLYKAHDDMLTLWKKELPQLPVVDLDVSVLVHGKLQPETSAGFIDNTLRWFSDVEGGNFRCFPIDGSDSERGEAKDANMIERWTPENFPASKFVIYQKFEKYPLGIYTFEAAAQCGKSGGKMSLYVGTSETTGEGTEITSVASLKHYSATYAYSTSSNRLVIGVKTDAENASQWVSMSDIKLTYKAPRAGLQELVDKAEVLIKTGEDVGGKLQSSIKSASDALANSTTAVSTLLTRYRSLQSQIKTFIQNNDVEVIAEASELCAELLILAENSVETVDGAKATFVSALNNATKQLETLRDKTKLQALCETLEKARQTYVLQAMPINNYEFDYTFLVKNADCSGTGSWMTDGVGNFQRMSNTAVSGEYVSGYFWEKWDIESYYFRNNDRPVYQQINSIPNGKYRLHLAAFRKNEFNTKTVNAGSMYVFLGDDKVEVTSEVLNYYDVYGSTESGSILLGLKAGANCNANWEALADVHLYYLGNPELTPVDDIDAFDSNDENVLDGKYLNNDKIVIYRNGKRYDINGVLLQ